MGKTACMNRKDRLPLGEQPLASLGRNAGLNEKNRLPWEGPLAPMKGLLASLKKTACLNGKDRFVCETLEENTLLLVSTIVVLLLTLFRSSQQILFCFQLLWELLFYPVARRSVSRRVEPLCRLRYYFRSRIVL